MTAAEHARAALARQHQEAAARGDRTGRLAAVADLVQLTPPAPVMPRMPEHRGRAMARLAALSLAQAEESAS